MADGEEAVRALETLPYDLVLMDVQMPEMDGLEATRLIRDPDSAVMNHGVPVIAMTARAQREDRERCLEAGMDGYVAKPVEPLALEQALNDALNHGPVEPAAVRPGGEAVFDPATLEGILDGNREAIREVLLDFAADARTMIGQIGRSLAFRDAAAVVRRAHALKGAAGSAGARGLQELAGRLEERAESRASGGGEAAALEAELLRFEAALAERGYTVEKVTR